MNKSTAIRVDNRAIISFFTTLNRLKTAKAQAEYVRQFQTAAHSGIAG